MYSAGPVCDDSQDYLTRHSGTLLIAPNSCRAWYYPRHDLPTGATNHASYSLCFDLLPWWVSSKFAWNLATDKYIRVSLY
jgi:hypothetical protein